MEANKDSAYQAVAVAKSARQSGDLSKARRLLVKARKLWPDIENIDVMIEEIEAEMASRHKNGGSGGSSSTAGGADTHGDANDGDGLRRRHFSDTASESSTTTTADSSEASKRAEPSAEQHAEAIRIVRARTHYEVLGVSKDECTTSIVKKRYRKLALSVHPDKNPSPKAEEAFKKVSRAYTTLSDAELKRIYDLSGCDENAAQQMPQFRRRGGGAHMHDMTPEELFAQFFFGNMQAARGANMHTFHFGPGFRGTQRRHARHRVAEEPHAASLLQCFVPFIILLLFSVLSGLSTVMNTSDPGFSLQRSSVYSVRRSTGAAYDTHDLPYFVKPSFTSTYPDQRSRSRIDTMVTQAYRDNCRRELERIRQNQRYDLWKGRYVHTRYSKAIAAPHCKMLGVDAHAVD